MSLSVISGCSFRDLTKPISPLFLEGVPLKSTIKRVPFQHAWAGEKPTSLKANTIYIRPVRTDILPADTWEKSTSIGIMSKEDFDTEVQLLAKYFNKELDERLRDVYKRHKRLALANSPSPNTVVLEIAFTEVVFARPVANALSLASPVPGTSLALAAMHEPHLAFAARFLAPDEKTLLGTLADRRFPPTRVIDLNKFTVTSSAREIISQWAREVAEAIEFDFGRNIERSSWFSFLPW